MEHNIIINVAGQSDLNNTTFYNGMTDANYSSLVSTDTHNDAKDVYLLSPDDSYSRAVDIPGIALAVAGSFEGTSVLSHEFGHCLGLFHTDSGRGCNDNANCSENINGSNCSTCGDLVCDTPADPCLYGNVNADCEYIGDPNFNPDVDNIMSYTPPDCLNSLTIGQRERMHHTIQNNPIFTNRIRKPEISDSSIVCSFGATFSINNPPSVDSLIWETGPYLTVYSGQNTNSPIIKATGSGNSWVTARLVKGCGSITLPQKSVWAGAPNHDYINIIGDDWVVPRKSIFSAVASRQMYIDDYHLDLPYGFKITKGQGTSIIHFNAPSGFGSDYYGLQLTNICGIGSRNYIIYEVPTLKNLVISPNPATSQVVLSIVPETGKEAFDETAEWDLEVYDTSQLLKEKKTGLRGKNAKLQTIDWKEGVYLVRVIYKGEILTGKLVVKR